MNEDSKNKEQNNQHSFTKLAILHFNYTMIVHFPWSELKPYMLCEYID